MKNFTVASLFCVLVALGAFAFQSSPQQPAPMPQSPGAASQNPQHPGATPPYVAPESQPGSAQNPQAQNPQTPTPQSEPSQAPPMHNGTSAVDDQVSALTTALNLSSDQQAKVKTILEDQHQQAVGVVSDSSLSRDAKLQKIHALRQSTIDKVRATLTTDDQKSKFDNMVQAQNDRIRDREQQQQQEPNNTQPPK
jgi:hypothetical protein